MRNRTIMAVGGIVAAFVLAIAGCAMGPSVDAAADADAIAASVAEPSDGFTQEALDLGGLLFGSGGGALASMAGPSASVFPVGAMRFFDGTFPGPNWTWDGTGYTREREDYDVTLPNHQVHVDAVLVRVQFYTSTDASGAPYGPVDFSGGFDPAIGSLTYHRAMSSTSTNLTNGTVNVHDADTDLAFTGIDIAAGSVTIDGTRTRSFDRTFTDGRTVVGTLSDTIADLELDWDADLGTLAWTGTLTYVFDATATRPNGTQVTRHREGTVVFSGSTTFTVTIDGATYTYRISDGARID